nr:hypothetical protein [Tanacetum cinerariifolium]
YNSISKSMKKLLTHCGDGVEILAMPSEHQSDDVKIFMMASERNRLNEALEDLAERRRQDSCNTVVI